MTFEYTRVPVKVRDWAESHRRNSQAINYLLRLSSDFETPLTTKGDIMGFDTASTRLAVGSDTQVLTADSAEATGLKWAPPTPLTTAGDILGHNGSSLVRRAVGTNGQVLTAVSANPDKLGWTTPFSDPLTTKGDIISRTSGSTVRVGVGSDGQVLTADSTAGPGVSWQTPSGGGGGGGAGPGPGWIFHEELDLSSGASVTSSTIPTFEDILVVGEGIVPPGSSRKFEMVPSGTITYSGGGFNNASAVTNWATVGAISSHSTSTTREFMCELKKWDTRDWWNVRGFYSRGDASNHHSLEGLFKVTAGTFNTLTFQWDTGSLSGGTVQIWYRPTQAPTGWQHLTTFNTTGTTTLGSYTSIPAEATELLMAWHDVRCSTNGTRNMFVNLGTGATPTYQNAGGSYFSGVGTNTGCIDWNDANVNAHITQVVEAAAHMSGLLHFKKCGSTDNWVMSGALGSTNSAATYSTRASVVAGSWDLGATLTAAQVIIDTDSFGGGTVDLYWA